MSNDLLPEQDKILLEILNDIVDKMPADVEDKDEIRTKIEKLHSVLHYNATGWK